MARPKLLVVVLPRMGGSLLAVPDSAGRASDKVPAEDLAREIAALPDPSQVAHDLADR